MELVERLLGVGCLVWCLWFAWQVVKMHITKQARADLLAELQQADTTADSTACHSPRCKEIASEWDLYREALAGLAYDPGWPEDPTERIEAMKANAFYTLRAATMLSATPYKSYDRR